MKNLLLAVYFFAVALTGYAQLPARVFNVTTYGAAGDGVTLDTPPINAAIEAAAAAGGGTVHFPAGNFLSFSIRLKSQVTLYLDSGCTIIAAEPPPDLSMGYDPPEACPTPEYQDFGHSHWHNSLIWGEDLNDIAILGPGRIFGRGLSNGRVSDRRRDFLPEERNAVPLPDLTLPPAALAAIAAQTRGPFGYPGPDALPAGIGNKAIALKNCRNVIFRDFTIYHGGHFGILGTGVVNWTVDNLKIDTNRDGIDIDGCINVRVSNCAVNTFFDDGICLKSSFGLGRPLPTENITIVNCQVSGYDEGTLLDGTRGRTARVKSGTFGRIKLGTESNGTFRNITIANCVFEYGRGLALESVDGALMEDITIANITMRDLVNPPIFIRLGSRLRAPAGTPVGTARRIKIDTLVAHNVSADGAILISGVPGHAIEDLSLSNILVDFVGGGTREQGTQSVPEIEKGYPEPDRFGPLPSWGLFARHVANLRIDRIELRTLKPDQRPAIVLDDVQGVSVDRLALRSGSDGKHFKLRNVSGFELRNSSPLGDVIRPEQTDEAVW
jgi:polygalacturonase